jgi:exonuclease III
MYIVNVYAPSVTSKRTEREEFYMLKLPYLIRQMANEYVIGGDFNCVMHQRDCIGTPSYSKALEALIRRCGLVDLWNSQSNRAVFTHYTANGASRIDRIYMSATTGTRK